MPRNGCLALHGVNPNLKNLFWLKISPGKYILVSNTTVCQIFLKFRTYCDIMDANMSQNNPLKMKKKTSLNHKKIILFV